MTHSPTRGRLEKNFHLLGKDPDLFWSIPDLDPERIQIQILTEAFQILIITKEFWSQKTLPSGSKLTYKSILGEVWKQWLK